MAARTRFLGQFLARPQEVGAVAPSSARLARRMLAGLDVEHADVVVELGPGTGAVTAEIRDAAGPGTHIVAVERNPEFARLVGGRFPGVEVVEGCATETHDHLRRLGHPDAACVVSGLPWASFPEGLQNVLLRSILKTLRPGGRFSTFAYYGPSLLPRARRFRRKLHSRFRQVEVTPVVWRNLPPAFAYRCEK